MGSADRDDVDAPLEGMLAALGEQLPERDA